MDAPNQEDLAYASARELSALMAHPAYEKYFVPLLKELIRSTTEQILVPNENRKQARPDDYLRGYVAACRAILQYPEATIARQEQRRKQDAEASAPPPLSHQLMAGGAPGGISPTDSI